MLELDPKKRISASKALMHPYFSTKPLACDPKDIPLLDGDSHEFLIRIQHGNKALAIKQDNSAMCGLVDRSKKTKQIIRASKRQLSIPQDESALAPSTKESCVVASMK